MISSIQQGLKDDGFEVSVAKLCRWFGVPRRTVYYRPTKAPPQVRPELAEPIKKLIEEEPSFGYRTVAGLLGMNKNTVQRIRHRLESQQHAMRVIADWIQFYNFRRPHQALGMKTPAEAYALAA